MKDEEVPLKFVDAHIHLSDPDYSQKVAYTIEEAKRCNVVALVSNSMNLETSARTIQLAKEMLASSTQP